MKKMFVSLAIIGMFLIGCVPIVDPIDDEPVYFQVDFLDSDGTLLIRRLVREGQAALAPEDPIKEGFVFTGWDEPFDVITENTVITATYEPDETERIYQVVFKDEDGSILVTRQVRHGEDAIAPSAPIKEGYAFLEWDKSFMNIQEPLEVFAVYRLVVIEVFHTVVFRFDDAVWNEQSVLKGEGAVQPLDPEKEGFIFLGWSRDFDSVNADMIVYAMFQAIPNAERIQYASHVELLSYKTMIPVSSLLDQMDYANSLYATITNIFYGGFRNADQIHLYEAANYRTRNIYGFEVAVDQNGVVVERGTLVILPVNGFILSGHSSTATFLQNQIALGDVIRYFPNSMEAKCYRDPNVSDAIGIKILIETAKTKIHSQRFDQMAALDYQTILEVMNQAIDMYNELADEYDYETVRLAKGRLLEVDFLLVEPIAVQVKSFWHYPLRSGSFMERNTEEVRLLMDQISNLGMNRVYLNTNFGGWSVYKSKYLTQQLTASYTYVGYKDYLDCFIKEAHMRGIEVYAWTNTLIAGDGQLSQWYRSRGWFQIGYQNEDNYNGMYFLDIANPEVQVFLENVYRELASEYELDGIEYDFIRYPGGNLFTFSGVITSPQTIKDSGYNTTFLDAFSQTYEFTGDFRTLIKDSQEARTAWLLFKKQLLNDTVEMLSTTIKEARPSIKISAAVMANINTARNNYLQDWDFWIGEGWVDALEPMIYSGSTTYVVTTLQSMLNTVAGRADVVAGIFPEGDKASSSVNAEQISAITEAAFSGWAKFSSKTIFGSAQLTQAMTHLKRDYVVLPTADANTIFIAYVVDLLDKTEHFYHHADTSNDYTELISLLTSIYQDKDSWTEDDLVVQLDLILDEVDALNDGVVKTRLLAGNGFIRTFIE